MFADLNPAGSGKVTWGKTDPDHVFVKFDQVKRYDKAGTGTVTVTMSVDGAITLDYGDVTDSVGVHPLDDLTERAGRADRHDRLGHEVSRA